MSGPSRAVGALALALLTAAPGVAVAASSASGSTLYVSPSGTPAGGDTGCGDAAYSSVQAAVDAAPAGGTVEVCAGTYDESVTIPKQLTLQGQPGAVIDAAGQTMGYGVGIAADDVTVEGLTVENAVYSPSTGLSGDGIGTAGVLATSPSEVVGIGEHATILDNVTRDNGNAGVDLDSTFGSLASGNTSTGNEVGIYIVDDRGFPSYGNRVSDNVANGNVGGCGIVLAEHSGKGVYDNVVDGNTANGNGTAAPGSGIFVGGRSATGGVWNNTIESNRASGNSNAGIVMHVHVSGKAKWSGNQFVDNVIGRNNIDYPGDPGSADYADDSTTGIYVGSVKKVSVKVSGNLIRQDRYGVFIAGPMTLTGTSTNAFQSIADVDYKRISTYRG